MSFFFLNGEVACKKITFSKTLTLKPIISSEIWATKNLKISGLRTAITGKGHRAWVPVAEAKDLKVWADRGRRAWEARDLKAWADKGQMAWVHKVGRGRRAWVPKAIR